MKFFIYFFLLISNTVIAEAYIGLGPLIPALGGAITFVLILLVAFFGLIAFPIKKLITYKRNKKNQKNSKEKN